MKLKFRIDLHNLRHVHFTVFQDHGNCGQLCMETKAFDELCVNLEASDIEFETELYNYKEEHKVYKKTGDEYSYE